MKKRMIALALVLCLVFSIIPVSAESGAAGTLTLGQELTVEPLAAGEERYYTVDVEAGTRYYFYYAPVDSNTEIGGDLDVYPVAPSLSSIPYQYDGYGNKNLLFMCESAETVEVRMKNWDEVNASNAFKVGVVATSNDVTSMTLSTTQYSISLDERFTLSTLFEPAFTFDENVVFSTDNPIVSWEENLRGIEIIPLSVGTANITATWANGSATCAVEVTEPADILDITNAPQNVTVNQNEVANHFLKFTAPSDADTASYVIYTEGKDEWYLQPKNFEGDWFQTEEYDILLPGALTPGKTYYLSLSSSGAEAATPTVTLEKSKTPSAMEIVGLRDHSVGNEFYMEVKFPTAAEYTYVDWAVEDSTIAEAVYGASCSAVFSAKSAGITKVVASVPGTNLTASFEIEVTDPNATPEEPPQAVSSVNIDVGDGTFTFVDQGVELTDQDYAYVEIPAGSTLASCGYGVTDVAYWETSRKLDGWEIHAFIEVTDEDGNFVKNEDILYEEGLYTTKGILDYPIPGDMNIFFRAKWAGDESDYMFSAIFDTRGGTVPVDVSDNSTPEIYDMPSFVCRVRKDGTARFSDAVAWTIVSDPTHPTDGTFKGWLKYTKDSNDVYQLFSEQLLTTSDIYNGAPANEDVTYAAKWSNVDIADYYGIYDDSDGPSTGNYVDVTLDGQGGTFTVMTADQTVPGVPLMPNSMMPGLRIRDHFTVTDVVNADSTLEFVGWMISRDICEVNADGEKVVVGEELLTQEPITTEEMLDFVIPDGEAISIVAQWGNPGEEGEDNPSNVTVDGNDGSFTCVAGDQAETGVAIMDLYVKPGKTIKEDGLQIKDVKFWTDRALKGWLVYTVEFVADEDEGYWEDVQIPGTGLMDTTAMLNYVIPADETVIFRAQWAGDDKDYYSDFYFDTLGGEIQITEPDGQISYTDGRGESLRKDGTATLANALPWKISKDPTHPNTEMGSFEGWLVYQIDEQGDAQLISEKLYTTAQILARAIPQMEERYVAKWSGLSMEDYYNMFSDNGGNEEAPDEEAPGEEIPEEGFFPVGVKVTEMKLGKKYKLSPAEDIQNFSFTAEKMGGYALRMSVGTMPLWINTEMYGGTGLFPDEGGLSFMLEKGDVMRFYTYPEETVEIWVESVPYITKLEILEQDTSKVFLKSDWVDSLSLLDGMTVKATYSDKTTAVYELSGYDCSLGDSWPHVEFDFSGKTGKATLYCDAASVDFTVKLESRQIVDFQIIPPADMYDIYEGINTYQMEDMYGNPFNYYDDVNVVFNLSTFRFTWSDGTVEDYTPGLNGATRFCGVPFGHDEGNQWEKPWTVGKNKVTAYFMELSDTFNVTVKKNIVKSVEFISVEMTDYAKGDPDYFYNDGKDMYLYSVNDAGLSFKANYLDGTSKVFNFEDMKDFYEVFRLAGNHPVFVYPGDAPVKNGKVECVLEYMGKADTFTVNVVDTAIFGNEASVSADVVTEALKNKTENTVTLNVTTAGEETVVSSVKLPMETLATLKEEKIEQVTIQLDSAMVTMDAKTLAAIIDQAEGETISLEVVSIAHDELLEKQQVALKDKTVGFILSANLYSNGKKIGDFKGGSVTVSVPFTPEEGKKGENFQIYYVDDEGQTEKMPTSYAEGWITFSTKHFSDYVAIEEEEVPLAPPISNPATGDSFMLLPLMLLMAVSAAAIVVMGKKRRV